MSVKTRPVAVALAICGDGVIYSFAAEGDDIMLRNEVARHSVDCAKIDGDSVAKVVTFIAHVPAEAFDVGPTRIDIDLEPVQ